MSLTTATADATMADGAMAEAMAEAMADAMAEAMAEAMTEAMAAEWDVAARDKNKHHGGRRGGKALLAEFLPNLRRCLPDCLTHQLDRTDQSPQPLLRSHCPWLF